MRSRATGYGASRADERGSGRRGGFTAFVQGLQELGWTDRRNVHLDSRWGAGDPDRIRTYAAELVALVPDVILASGGSVVGALREATRTVPIVFTQVPNAVGAGFVDTLAQLSEECVLTS